MTQGLTVEAGERGLVRVFALSMDEREARILRDNEPPADDDQPVPQAAALGAEYVDSDFTEVFPVGDLGQLGLSGYLIEGNGIDPASLGRDRARLDALDGWVFLVYSAAFGGFAQTLRPENRLTLIGTYAEPGVDWAAKQVLQSEAAKASADPARRKPSDAAMSGRVAMAALLVIFALTAFVVWLAG